MKATNAILIGLGALLVLRKVRGAAGVGHPADWYTIQDLDNYKLYLESGYGKDFLPTELKRNERARLELLEEAVREHERRRSEFARAEKGMRRHGQDAIEAFNKYVHFLNNKYGRGFHPGLIAPDEAKIYQQLFEDAWVAEHE